VAVAEVEERQLLKAMTWWDGFVVALANPGFLIAALGSSIGALGTTGAFVLWTVSITFGALQNNIHAELACMFPHKSGGIALYAHEAWRKYLTFVGPLATFGYWIGWSVVLSINGLVAGTLIQAEWFSKSTWAHHGAGFDLTLPIAIGIGLIVLVWITNIYGVRPAVWFGYVTGALLCIPVFVLMFFPYITGDWHSSNMQWNIGTGGGIPLVLTWLYFMCWSAYGIEVVATFAPEYHDTERDTPKALRSSALFCVAVYALLPLGLGGTLGTKAVADDATFISFYTQAFDKIVGNGLANVMIACIVGGLVLSMNTATMDGSRALFGISRDGMTIRELGVLNRFRVPGRAMTIDAILNIFLITYFTGVLPILAVSNVGYVFATCCALSGFLLLRKDRPNWPRPIRLSSIWVPICAVLLAINTVLLVAGGFIYSGGFLGITGYGYGWDKTRTGLFVLLAALILYIYRHVVQDRIPLRLREEIPQTPEELYTHPELAPAGVGAADDGVIAAAGPTEPEREPTV
jgi:amino acid transporter